MKTNKYLNKNELLELLKLSKNKDDKQNFYFICLSDWNIDEGCFIYDNTQDKYSICDKNDLIIIQDSCVTLDFEGSLQKCKYLVLSTSNFNNYFKINNINNIK